MPPPEQLGDLHRVQRRTSIVSDKVAASDGYAPSAKLRTGKSQTRRKLIERVFAGASSTAPCARPNIAASPR
jgi:hypothetical protein